MKREWIALTVFLFVVVSVGCSAEESSVVAPGAKVEKLCGGFGFTEGPAVDARGNVYFSDIPNNSIFEWSEREGLKLYLNPSGYTDTLPRGGEIGSNGLLLDEAGSLVLCQHGDRRVARMNAALYAPAANFETIVGSLRGQDIVDSTGADHPKELCGLCERVKSACGVLGHGSEYDVLHVGG